MLNDLVTRLGGRKAQAPDAVHLPQPGNAHIEICPPALRRSAQSSGWREGWRESWQAGLRDWLQSTLPTSSRHAENTLVSSTLSGWNKELTMTVQASSPLSLVRREFINSLGDMRTQQAGDLVGRMRIARSMHELWHLRIDVYNLVAQHHDESEATRRLNRLNRFFPQRVGRPSIGTPIVHADRRSPAR